MLVTGSCFYKTHPLLHSSLYMKTASKLHSQIKVNYFFVSCSSSVLCVFRSPAPDCKTVHFFNRNLRSLKIEYQFAVSKRGFCSPSHATLSFPGPHLCFAKLKAQTLIELLEQAKFGAPCWSHINYCSSAENPPIHQMSFATFHRLEMMPYMKNMSNSTANKHGSLEKLLLKMVAFSCSIRSKRPFNNLLSFSTSCLFSYCQDKSAPAAYTKFFNLNVLSRMSLVFRCSHFAGNYLSPQAPGTRWWKTVFSCVNLGPNLLIPNISPETNTNIQFKIFDFPNNFQRQFLLIEIITKFPLLSQFLNGTHEFSELVLTRTALLMDQSGSVLPFQSVKTRELTELWREINFVRALDLSI